MAIGPYSGRWSGDAPGSVLGRRQGNAQRIDGGIPGGAVGEGWAVRHALAVEPDAETQVVASYIQRLAGLQLFGHLTGSLAVGKVARQQQLLAVGGQQAEAETAVVFAEADEAGSLGGFLLGAGGYLDLADKRTQANGLAQFVEERRCHGPGFFAPSCRMSSRSDGRSMNW